MTKSIGLIFTFLSYISFSQVNVIIDLNSIHQVDNIKTFEREKWITTHAVTEGHDWKGEIEKLKYITNDLDVYFGRSTGTFQYYSTLIEEDPNKKGYADLSSIKKVASQYKKNYALTNAIYAFEKGDIIRAAQQQPYFPNGENPMKNGNWFFSAENTENKPLGTASAEYQAHFINHFYGDGEKSGAKRPNFYEVMNEPLWPYIDMEMHGAASIKDIFIYHKTVADVLHKEVKGLQVGGFCTAFPDLDKNNFNQWEERWKLFIDEIGPSMDFYSIHLYDFPIYGEKQLYRKGGRNEATMDMIEHYNYLKYGAIKPWIISEYGAQTHNLNRASWSSLRDWYNVEAFNAMLMQFLDRPNTILRAIPFGIPKAEWGFNKNENVPYTSRLLRKKGEPKKYKGDWIWTDFIKFYEQWSEVKGTRLVTTSSDIDVQVQSYFNEKELFVVLNNIDDQAHKINLDLKGTYKLEQLTSKRLFLKNEKTKLAVEILDDSETPILLQKVETVVLKFIFQEEILPENTRVAHKQYAKEFKVPITENQIAISFTQHIDTSENAVLRLGVGRSHSVSPFPSKIMVNGQNTPVPKDFRGDMQSDRDNFFSLLEIPVNKTFLNNNRNTIEIQFADLGGFITSSALISYEKKHL